MKDFKQGQQVVNLGDIPFTISGSSKRLEDFGFSPREGEENAICWPVRRGNGSDAGWYNERYIFASEEERRLFLSSMQPSY